MTASAVERKVNVLVLGASLPADSLNRELAALAARLAEEGGAVVDHASMREFDVPSCDGDDEKRDGLPEGAEEFRRRITESDAFVISPPEYNCSMPGVLKNLIDWTSRSRPQPFDGKHGLLLSASPSMVGGNRALWALRVPFEHLGARIFPGMFSLAQSHKALVDGDIADAALRARLEATMAAFLSLAEASKNYPCIKRAWVEFLGEPPGGEAETAPEGSRRTRRARLRSTELFSIEAVPRIDTLPIRDPSFPQSFEAAYVSRFVVRTCRPVESYTTARRELPSTSSPSPGRTQPPMTCAGNSPGPLPWRPSTRTNFPSAVTMRTP